MKIFSLQSKTNLVVWGVILGLLVFLFFQISNFKVVKNTCPPNALCTPSYIESKNIYYYGYPFQAFGDDNYTIINGVYVLNFIFWFLISLIILSLIRYLRYKKSKALS